MKKKSDFEKKMDSWDREEKQMGGGYKFPFLTELFIYVGIPFILALLAATIDWIKEWFN